MSNVLMLLPAWLLGFPILLGVIETVRAWKDSPAGRKAVTYAGVPSSEQRV